MARESGRGPVEDSDGEPVASWLDGFHGEAIWPALPLPPPEQYDTDLAFRFSKLTAFLHQHLPVAGLEASETGDRGQERCLETLGVYGSPARHFRARCRFALQRGDDCMFHYYLWNGADNCPTLLADVYPAATLGIYLLMPRLLAYLNGDALVLTDGVRAVHFLTVKDGSQCVVTLIYDKPLPDSWSAAAQALMDALGSGVSVQGRSKGKHMMVGSESGILHCHL
jgi:hypothetical protein